MEKKYKEKALEYCNIVFSLQELIKKLESEEKKNDTNGKD